jgi:hypothetical protein
MTARESGFNTKQTKPKWWHFSIGTKALAFALLAIVLVRTVQMRDESWWLLRINNRTDRIVQIRIDGKILRGAIAPDSSAILPDEVWAWNHFECEVLDSDQRVIETIRFDSQALEQASNQVLDLDLDRKSPTTIIKKGPLHRQLTEYD